MVRTGVCFLAWVALSFVSSLAHAQDDECAGSNEEQARPLYEAGRVAYDAGRYEQALRYFQDAYELCRRPAFLFNIASSADRLSENRRALESYRAYLAAMPSAPNAEMVRNRIAFLERQIAGPRHDEEDGNDDAVVLTNGNGHQTDTRPSGGGDITGEWWFWTLIGVGAVGVILAITLPIALLSGGVQGPMPGTVDTFTALVEF